jgi:chromosome segregation protein
MERLKLAIEGISQQAIEKYHLNIAEREYTVDPDFDEKKVSRDVNKLRSKIDELGAINMMAIEEYDELMRRLDFITAQREEVFNSINLLEDALEEIEETTKNRFAETFAVVNSEFQNLFPILFPGGEGRLDMNAPEDPLNTGVEIIARLPGKKPQRMTLLSGGEKALTAISLIFALLKTKPTPFCFLDEVDAPLDEANVGRYNKVLEALSDRFQFIVITHNRRTMEVLDTLFGVTMQEPGVSKIVGVDMKKDIPDHLKKAFKEEERIGASAH